MYKATLTVTFKNIPSVAITLANQLTYKTTDLEINQAIKSVINTDPTLNKLLVAQDGPGNTLVVTSLIDGARTTTDLAVVLALPPTSNVFSAAELAGMSIAYNLGNPTLAAIQTAQTTALASFTTAAEYATASAADSAGTAIVGANSVFASDNFITPGAGNDVIVLGTDATSAVPANNAALTSNDVIIFGAGFGDDVIVNFAIGATAPGQLPNSGNLGGDHLDFSAFLTQATPATATAASGPVAAVSFATLANNVDNQIERIVESTANDTLAEVTVLIKAAIDATVSTVATKQLYITVTPILGGGNVGTVYSVVNGLAINDAIITREGSIDLADTDWFLLTTLELVGVPVGAQVEGASSAI